ncbi:MAG: hypothetical protein K5790_06275 [Nitrosopumilus sp.]|uniref:hypothetical protein n=1 Tax=Nitrosopumilus sp. TaxID=2024843 RepID=UPI00247D856B|nr:hypothetical protein [Nitrosopumilus sp.]MCV0392885.1 hypothetical protein [Nitrosopumilus sp.]
MGKEPRSIIVKTMVTTKVSKDTFEFFSNLKNWEFGGALKNIQKDKDDWWVCNSPFGEVKIRLRSNEKFGILDHDFIGGGGEWTVSCRVTPNESGSTVTWLFIRPEPMTQKQFEEQLKNFDNEIMGWKKALES